MSTLWAIIAACTLGTVISLALAVVVAYHVRASWISTLVSYAVGAMLGAAFLDLLPHIFEESKNPGRTASFILLGLLVFFILEKLLLWRHHHQEEEEVRDDRTGAHRSLSHVQGHALSHVQVTTETTEGAPRG